MVDSKWKLRHIPTPEKIMASGRMQYSFKDFTEKNLRKNSPVALQCYTLCNYQYYTESIDVFRGFFFFLIVESGSQLELSSLNRWSMICKILVKIRILCFRFLSIDFLDHQELEYLFSEALDKREITDTQFINIPWVWSLNLKL